MALCRPLQAPSEVRWRASRPPVIHILLVGRAGLATPGRRAPSIERPSTPLQEEE